MMPRGGREPRIIGILLGLGTIIGLMAYLLTNAVEDKAQPSLYYYVFTTLAAICAVQVITHAKAVYSALYFVLTVVAASGLLVLLEAEFMAFALILVYGGAILVTYMFVIMLATQPITEDSPDTGLSYDREARSPIMAVAMGFIVLACVSSAMYSGTDRQSTWITPNQHITPTEAAGMLKGKFDTSKQSVVHKLSLELVARKLITSSDEVTKVYFNDDEQLVADYKPRNAIGVKAKTVVLEDDVLQEFVPNIDRVGLNLFMSHTLGIELAGIILLLSMVGAIVLARKQVLPHHVEPVEDES